MTRAIHLAIGDYTACGRWTHADKAAAADSPVLVSCGTCRRSHAYADRMAALEQARAPGRKLATATGILAAVLLALTLAGCGAGQASHHGLVIKYTVQQPTCTQAQIGKHALVIGDGPHPFTVTCRRNGPIDTWDASPVARG